MGRASHYRVSHTHYACRQRIKRPCSGPSSLPARAEEAVMTRTCPPLLIVTVVVAAVAVVSAPVVDSNDAWLSAAREDMQRREYQLRYQEGAKAYQSPNRRQNLRVTYHDDGFTLVPRDQTRGSWRVNLRLRSIGRNERAMRPRADVMRKVHGTSLDIYHGADFTIHYENGTEGMRQDFIVRRKPAGDGDLTVTLAYDGDLALVDKGTDAVLFAALHRERGRYDSKVWYKDLRAYDADGKRMPATMRVVDEHTIALVVDDRDARYPLTVDPLSTTADWVTDGAQPSMQFGHSVGPAGDVNGDGYGDVIVGAPRYDGGQTWEGAAFVYLGSATGLSTSPHVVLEEDGNSAHFGSSVNTAGDVNGDGYSDVIVGAPRFTLGYVERGAAYIYLGGPSGVSAAYHRRLTIAQSYVHFGSVVATAGDVQNDGYSDVIVGAPDWSNGHTGEGYVAVYYGSASGVDETPDWEEESNLAGARMGCAVSTAGDVNNDTYSDIIIGAKHYSNGQFEEGVAYVYHGGAGGLSGVADAMLEVNQLGAYFGTDVACAGDVNGDGYSDVVVGAPEYVSSVEVGAIFVYHGSSVGVGGDYDDWSASGYGPCGFGRSVSGAGDVNGDGFGDIVVGAPEYTNDQEYQGRVFLFYGSDSRSIAGLWEQNGAGWHDQYGRSVASAGDVNGDGYSDIIVGAEGYSSVGRAYAYYGSEDATGLDPCGPYLGEQEGAAMGTSIAGGDFNGDGYSDVAIAASEFDNGQTDEGMVFVYQGGASGLTFCKVLEVDIANACLGSAMSSAGDVNGDGLVDLIVGASTLSDGESQEGGVFLFYGVSGSEVLSSVPGWNYQSNHPLAMLGSSVAGAGDLNGDGFGDLLIGAPGYSGPEQDEGAVFVFHGSAAGPGAAPDRTYELDEEGARLGASVSSAGDVDGDGFSDAVFGASRRTQSGFTSCGMVFVYHGSPNGLRAEAKLMYFATQDDAEFGAAVTFAGDVNGDGYSDIAVGAPMMNTPTNNCGKVFIYHGGPNGTLSAPARTLSGAVADAGFGFSVSSAGDVNGDGYSDIIIGSPYYSNPQSAEGRIDLFLGSAGGIASTPYLSLEYNQAQCCLGSAVACVGDINGDGLSDFALGGPCWSGHETGEGCAVVYTGGRMWGTHASSQQYQAGYTTPVASGGLTSTTGTLHFRQFAKTPFGRVTSRIHFEHRAAGEPFSGDPITSGFGFTGPTGVWQDHGYYAQQATVNVSTPSVYKWRARVEYALPKVFNGQKYGPWRYSMNEYAHQGGVRSHSMAAPSTPTIVRPPCNAVIGMADTLVWTSVSGAGVYGYQVSTTGDFGTIVKDGTEHSARTPLTGLENGTTYYARVNAQNTNGASLWSTVDTFTTIAQPTLVSPEDDAGVTDLTPTLRWNRIAARKSYTMQLARDPSFTTIVAHAAGLTDTSTTVTTTLEHGTAYYWRIGVRDSTDVTTLSSSRGFTTVCDQVSLVSPADGTRNCPFGQVLRWRAARGATGYRLEIATNGRFTTVVKDTVTADTTYGTVSDPNTAYFWRVRAVNPAGAGQPSQVWGFKTALEAPQLQLPADGAVDQPTALSVQWGSVSGANAYHLQVSTLADFSVLFVDAAGLTTNSYGLSGLANSTRYYWRVRATEKYGASAWSPAWSFVTEAGITEVPLLLAPAQGETDVRLSPEFVWHALQDAIDYDVQVSAAADFSNPVVNETGVTDTAYAGSGLARATTYHWRVRARLSAGTTSWSAVRTFTTIPDPPAQVTLVAPSDAAVDVPLDVELVWAQADGADSYRVQISTRSDMRTRILDTTGVIDTTLRVYGLDDGVQYYWHVCAVNAGGSGAWSSVRTFTTVVNPPPQVFLLSPDSGAIDQPGALILTWRTADGAESYDAQVATVGDFSTTVTDSSGTTDTTLQMRRLDNDVTYYWRVRARNSGGVGPWSPVWSFTTIVARPGAVTLVEPQSGETIYGDSVDLVWNIAAPAVTKYWLEVSTDSTFASALLSDSALTDTISRVGGYAHSARYYWRVRAANIAGWGVWSTKAYFYVEPPVAALPREFAFSQGGLRGSDGLIRYALPAARHVSMHIFDMRGKRVATLVNALQPPGYYSVPLDSRRLAAGCNVVVFQAGEYVVRRRLLSVR
ncbi:MAG: hypothetical protein GF331_15490 [Chitinivibrionales bacterium]|nr:hypothetical protein [Chitinivibrionales bacterium]